MALGWLLAAGFLRAEAPMDLNSPFPKVALVRGNTGEIEKRDIQQARLVGASVEMRTVSGGMAIFPEQDVLAILPIFPEADGPYTVEQAEGAIRLYERATPDLLQKAGLGSTGMQHWKKLKQRLLEIKKQKEQIEQQEKKAKETESEAQLKKEVRDWIQQASELRVSRTEKELTELKKKGETLVRKSPEQMDALLEGLAALSQVQPKEKGEPLPELQKLKEVQPRLVPDDLLGWLAGGVLIASFFGLLFGLAFLSSSLTRFKEGAWLRGIVFGLGALGVWGVLIRTWLPAKMIGDEIPSRVDPKMEELGIYLKNKARPVYYFPAKEFSFSAAEWRSGVLGYLPVSEEAFGLFKVKMKEGKLRLTEGKWTWQQPLTALGVPLPFSVTFEGINPDLLDWENPAPRRVYLGRWVLPDWIGGMLKDSASAIYKQGLASGGLTGVRLEKDGQGMILISVPVAGTKPKYELAKEEEKQQEISKPVSSYKKELSAEELAKAIVDRKGRDFLDKFVVIHGQVHSVGGSNFSSVGKMGRDQLEDIYLLGMEDFYGIGRPLLIKCQIKSDVVFQMDSRGDLYMRYVIQEFEQDKKKPTAVQELFEEKRIRFYTIDNVEVTSPSIDSAKERPLIYRRRRIQFLSPQRLELKASEVDTGIAVGGITGRPPGTNQAGEIELYGVVLAPGGEINKIIIEKDP